MTNAATSAIDATRAGEPGRGRAAAAPGEIPATGWKDILFRVWEGISHDRISLIAAGVTFYSLLALFPALTAFVSLYGLVSDPRSVADQVGALAGVLPSDAISLIDTQLRSLTQTDGTALGFGFFFGLALALWSANAGMKSVIEGLNVAYQEDEKRGFITLNLVSLAFTAGAIVLAILFLVGVAVVPVVLSFVGASAGAELAIKLLRWPLLLVVAALGIAVLHRFGPSRDRAKWRWVTWGSAITVVVWLIVSACFSWYLENFANYDKTYGSLGAVIGVMMWLWVSSFILLVGAEINAEMEHQTAIDTTAGVPRPLGERGAVMADTVGVAAGKPPAGPADKDADRRNAPVTVRQRSSEDFSPLLMPALIGAGALLALAIKRIENRP